MGSSSRLKLIIQEQLSLNKLQFVTNASDLALKPAHERAQQVQEYVKGLLSSSSGCAIDEVDLNVGLYKYGIDSIGASNISMLIKDNLGASLEVNLC